MKFKRLNKKFFSRHPTKVAKNLLGKYLIIRRKNIKIVAKIIETEAYGGKEDKGCHIGRFGLTKRTSTLFGDVARAYVYPVHINTYCLNVVSHKKNSAGGVLIRGIEIISPKNQQEIIKGPGKICRRFKIDTSFTGEDMINGRKIYFTEGEKVKKEKILSTPRINIPYAEECRFWLWRYVIKDYY